MMDGKHLGRSWYRTSRVGRNPFLLSASSENRKALRTGQALAKFTRTKACLRWKKKCIPLGCRIIAFRLLDPWRLKFRSAEYLPEDMAKIQDGTGG